MVFDDDSSWIGCIWEDDVGCEEAHFRKVSHVHVFRLRVVFEEHEASVVLEALICGNE